MNGVFERVTTAAIVANVALVAAGQIAAEHEAILETGHNVILGIFAVELCVHLGTHGWRFFRRPANVVDAALILASLLPALGVDAGLLRLARLARLIHLGRHISGLRLLRLLPPAARLQEGVATRCRRRI